MELDLNADSDFNELEKAKKKGLFGRLSQSFDDAIQTGRAPERTRDAVAETAGTPHVGADDLALRRAKTVTTQKMIIPEGVIIEGSLTGGSDTEINGRIDGDITVEGRLFLGASALISGNVRAGSCRVDGLVDGRVECSDELELGQNGRLNADVIAHKRIKLAGQVYGNVSTPGGVLLGQTCKVDGDLRTRSLMMEEGAMLNGRVTMRAPAQQKQQGAAKEGKK